MRDDAWSESYVATQINEVAANLLVYLDQTSARTCPPEKSVHLETVAFRESRPVALPNPLHLATLSARLFSGLVHSASEGSRPSSVLELRAFQPRSYAVSLLVWISRLWNDWPHYQAVTQIQQLTSNFPRFNEMIGLTTVRPIVGKFEGIVFT